MNKSQTTAQLAEVISNGTVIPIDSDGNLVWLNQFNESLDRFEKLLQNAKELSTQQLECEQKVAEAVKAEREKFAKYLYEQMPYDGTGEKPKWIDGGNSLKQDEARKMVLTAPTNTEGEDGN